MKKFISLLFVLGFILYLKPGFQFEGNMLCPNKNCMKIKYISGEGMVSSIGQQGRIIKVVGEDSKRYYIPVDNILYIIEE